MHDQKPEKYHVIIDHRPHDWPEPTITGAKIRELAGVDASYQVWQEFPGKDDRPIADEERANIAEHGTEHFFTAKKTTTEG